MKSLLILLTAMIFAGCSSSSDTSYTVASFENTKWVIANIDGKAPSSSVTNQPYIVFTGTTGNVSGNSGCNTFSGSYTSSGNSLTFSPIAATKMFCDGAMDFEQSFLNLLNECDSYLVSNNILTLYGKDGRKAMFKPAN
ncbi:MAG TPA: META domain-containing protein [Ignavibacteria bacterium]|nr:META domain-containing protein [Ignavibacteria bacterium]